MSRVQEFDFSVDLLRALLWQYNEAEKLEGLLREKQAWYDANQSTFWSDWITDVFDLRTANDFGLAVWSIILNIPLVILSQDDPDKPIFGFEEFRENFNNGNFASTTGSALTTEQKRIVLRLRYFQLVTRGAIPEVNRFLAYLFESQGPAYVVDGYNMTARYVFGFPVSSAFEAVLTEYDLLPRPAGVKIDFVIIGDADGFGFGRYHENFTNGNFYHA